MGNRNTNDGGNNKFRPKSTEKQKNGFWIERVQSATYDDVRKKVEDNHADGLINRVRERYEEQPGYYVNSVGSTADTNVTDDIAGSQANASNGINQEKKYGTNQSANVSNGINQEKKYGTNQNINEENKNVGSNSSDNTENTDNTDSDTGEAVDKNEFDYKKMKEIGQAVLKNNNKPAIHMLNIIGEVEGHIGLPQQTKATKYEHVIPELAAIENNDEIKGVLVLLNTVGGDVEAGLAISELIASISKPTVSLVLGGSHSIGVPLAVAANYSFIVPSATMIIHPVRMNGTVIGIPQTFEYFERMQERILDFIVRNSNIDKNRLKNLMLDTGKLAKDVGSILVGIEAVHEGIIDEIGGIKEAFDKLFEMIELRAEPSDKEAADTNEEHEGQ